MRSNVRLFFFYLLGFRFISSRWSVVKEKWRGYIFFSNLSEDVNKMAIPFHAFYDSLLPQSFLIFFWRCRFSLFIFQIKISFLGSPDIDLLSLAYISRCLISHIFVPRSLNSATSQGSNFGTTSWFILHEVLFHGKKKLIYSINYFINSFKYFINNYFINNRVMTNVFYCL